MQNEMKKSLKSEIILAWHHLKTQRYSLHALKRP